MEARSVRQWISARGVSRHFGHFVVVSALLSTAATSSVIAQTADEAVIRDLVKQYAEARNRGDAKALDALFVPEADQLVSSGEWRKGRDAVVKGSLASSQASAGQRAFTVETIRLVAARTAIVDSRYEIAATDGGAPRRMWATWILVKTADGWRIAAIRNMLPAK
jgi:uncharacterized protein (TIGR02246 family)